MHSALSSLDNDFYLTIPTSTLLGRILVRCICYTVMYIVGTSREGTGLLRSITIRLTIIAMTIPDILGYHHQHDRFDPYLSYPYLLESKLLEIVVVTGPGTWMTMLSVIGWISEIVPEVARFHGDRACSGKIAVGALGVHLPNRTR